MASALRKSVLVVAAVASVALSGCSQDSTPEDGGEAAAPPRAAGADDPAGRDDREGRGGSVRGKTIVIDPGHNGGNADAPKKIGRQVDVITERKECDTTGTATADGYTEHAFAWDVSQRLAELLRSRGANVALTRSDDEGVGPCIDERARIGNARGADAVVSVHADGAPASARGFHIIEPAPIKGHTDKIVPDSRRLGRAIRDAYRAGTDLPYSTYRGKKAIDRRDDLGGLNLSTVPKVFIECGNMRNAGEAAKFSRAKFRQRIAESLADGFDRYFA